MKTAVLSSLLAACLTGSVAHAADLLVPKQFPTIQAAIAAAANGDRVLVSPGTYHEQVNLSGKGIHLIGVGGAAVTALDGDTARTVIVGNGEPDTCLVQGFTIQNGFTTWTGGGVFVENSSLRVTDCVFSNNRATANVLWGAASWLSRHGSPTISRCIFRNNVSQGTNAGVFHYLSGSISVSDCLFTDNLSNSARAIQVQNEGGSIAMSIQRCVFRGIGNIDTSASIQHSPIIFWSPWSGSLTGSVTDCVFDRPIVTSSVSASQVAVFIFGGGGFQVTLTNNTACEFPRWAMGDAYVDFTGWTNGGGNILTPTCCPSDLDGNGIVNAVDLAMLLAQWGDCIGCRADTTADDGIVEGKDLAELISAWGVCQ